VRGGEQGTARPLALLCQVGERLCEFPPGKTFPGIMISCSLSGTYSLGLPIMAKHYQKRIRSSRYLGSFLSKLCFGFCLWGYLRNSINGEDAIQDRSGALRLG